MSELLDAEARARALEMVRVGEGVTLGSVGGKCSQTLVCRSGQFCIEEFDEGQSFDRPITEQQAIQALANHPDAVQELLARPLWQRFCRAFIEGDRHQAQAALDATAGLPGPVARFRFVYEAILAWPDRRPSSQLKEQLKSFAEGGMALHPLHTAAEFVSAQATAARSLEYLTALGEITGWSRSLYLHRADCHERLGNLQAALDDLLLEQKFYGGQQARIRDLRAALKRRGRTDS